MHTAFCLAVASISRGKCGYPERANRRPSPGPARVGEAPKPEFVHSTARSSKPWRSDCVCKRCSDLSANDWRFWKPSASAWNSVVGGRCSGAHPSGLLAARATTTAPASARSSAPRPSRQLCGAAQFHFGELNLYRRVFRSFRAIVSASAPHCHVANHIIFSLLLHTRTGAPGQRAARNRHDNMNAPRVR